ncbi:MAG: hypothetical protein AAF849_04115 [Bacteroidota bacterium]
MKIIWVILGAFSLLACQERQSEPPQEIYEHIEDVKARALLEKAVNAAGGLDEWTSKKSISFQKYVALYDSMGTIEQENWQQHTYHYSPERKVKIAWEKEASKYEILAEKNQFRRLVSGAKDTSVTVQSIENTVRSATFVISLPFKLLNEGVELAYKGKKQLDTGQEVEVLQAIYDAKQHATHTNQDIWSLYFDAKDYRLLGYQVQHDDHISYVLNNSFDVVNGIVFPRHRKSYRVNEEGERLFLRAAYEYKDWTIKNFEH